MVHQRGRRRGQSVSTQTSLISHGGDNNQASSSMMTPSDHSGGLAASALMIVSMTVSKSELDTSFPITLTTQLPTRVSFWGYRDADPPSLILATTTPTLSSDSSNTRPNGLSSDSVTTSFGFIADSRVGVVVNINIEERDDDRDGEETDGKMTYDLTVFIRSVNTTNVTAVAAPRKQISGGDNGETGDISCYDVKRKSGM